MRHWAVLKFLTFFYVWEYMHVLSVSFNAHDYDDFGKFHWPKSQTTVNNSWQTAQPS